MNPNIDLVPINHAMSLRSLGFDENTDYTYYELPDGEIKPEKIHFPDNIIVARAPYFQEVFRWLRDKHNLDKCIDHMISEGNAENKKGYFYQIVMKPKGLFINSIYHEDKYGSYELAELACLDRMLKIVAS